MLLLQALQKVIFKIHIAMLVQKALQKVVFKIHTATLSVRALQYFVFPGPRKKKSKNFLQSNLISIQLRFLKYSHISVETITDIHRFHSK